MFGNGQFCPSAPKPLPFATTGGLADVMRAHDWQAVPALVYLKTPATNTGPARSRRPCRARWRSSDGKKWRTLHLAGMLADHSWDRSAREYVRMYERALGAQGRE